MKIIFTSPENAWGGFLNAIRARLPRHEFLATGGFYAESLAGYDVLIPTMCAITRELIASADRLRLIQQCGAGLEGVDAKAAKAKGIWVANVPTDISGNADSVAELGIFLMIGLARDWRRMKAALAQGKMGEPQGRALYGRTVGIVGLGGIGRALAARLKPFGVRLIGIKGHDPEKAKVELGLEWAGLPRDLPELLRRSDYVALCLPMNAETKSLMNRETFACMKKEAFLINLSRGGLVERGALEEALAQGQIAGAGLDVFWREPPPPDDPIFQYNVLATPHIGGSTDISMQGIVEAVAENIERLERGETPKYVKK